MLVAEIYQWEILVGLVGSMLHVLVLLAFRRRVSPWRAKILYALGGVCLFSWLYYRVWTDGDRNWVAVSCLAAYLAGLFYLIFSYRQAPYQGGNTNGQ